MPRRRTPPPAFPLETIFPGIHAARPDIAEGEGEAYLAHGQTLRERYDPADPTDRTAAIDVPAEQFVEFPIEPLDAGLRVQLDKIPVTWEADGRRAEVEQWCADAATHYKLPPHLQVIIVRDGKQWEAWVWKK